MTPTVPDYESVESTIYIKLQLAGKFSLILSYTKE